MGEKELKTAVKMGWGFKDADGCKYLPSEEAEEGILGSDSSFSLSPRGGRLYLRERNNDEGCGVKALLQVQRTQCLPNHSRLQPLRSITSKSSYIWALGGMKEKKKLTLLKLRFLLDVEYRITVKQIL